MTSQEDREKINKKLQELMNLKQKDSKAAASEVTRESNSSYMTQNQKFMVKRQSKEHMLQYATLYFLRLAKLRPMVEEAASMKWQDDNLKIVENILDI